MVVFVKLVYVMLVWNTLMEIGIDRFDVILIFTILEQTKQVAQCELESSLHNAFKIGQPFV